MIRHIVMWKFREGEEENREKFLSGLQALDGVIPEIRHMEIHRSCKPGNPYDACLIADFDDLEALSRYKNDRGGLHALQIHPRIPRRDRLRAVKKAPLPGELFSLWDYFPKRHKATGSAGERWQTGSIL